MINFVCCLLNCKLSFALWGSQASFQVILIYIDVNASKFWLILNPNRTAADDPILKDTTQSGTGRKEATAVFNRKKKQIIWENFLLGYTPASSSGAASKRIKKKKFSEQDYERAKRRS